MCLDEFVANRRLFYYEKCEAKLRIGGEHLVQNFSAKNEQKIFKLHSEYAPTGDQPAAIAELVKGFQEGNQFQTLLGVTGSGKTFTMANLKNSSRRTQWNILSPTITTKI